MVSESKVKRNLVASYDGTPIDFATIGSDPTLVLLE
jgi:hypothetical protein